MKPKINRCVGTLPPTWKRPVIFFANIVSLFYGNTSETDVLRQTVGTLESYGGRLIPILNLLFRDKSNLLLLERSPNQELVDYFENDLHLKLPEIKIVPHDIFRTPPQEDNPDMHKLMDLFKKHPAKWMDGYVTDDILDHWATLTHKSTITTKEGSRRGNNKLLLYHHLESLGLPVFDTCIANSINEVEKCFETLRQHGYKQVVIKAAIGASGIGMKKLSAWTPQHVPKYLFYEGPCLVQGWLDDSIKGTKCIGSPSVQMFLDEETIYIHDITEQFLSRESVHQGNIAPPPYLTEKIKQELLNQSEMAGTWLFNQQYKGTASVDFLLSEKNSKLDVRICEINARVTGATYPALLARHFRPGGAWLMRNIRFSPAIPPRHIIDLLHEQKLLYRLNDEKGILPINFNLNPDGLITKGQFLSLGESTDEVWQLLHELSKLPSIKGDFDRD